MRLQLNNRRLIEGFYRGIGAPDVPAVMRAVDKIDKISPDAVAELLQADAGLSSAQAAACLALAEIVTPDASFADRVRALGVSDPLLDQGVEELAEVVDGAVALRSDRVEVTADLRIARGLDYYTGTVYETRLRGHGAPGLGVLGRPVRLLGHGRRADLSRGGHLLRDHPGAGPAVRPGRPVGQS